jgi:hypothetical protein
MGMFRSRLTRCIAVPLFLAVIMISGAGCSGMNQAPIINTLTAVPQEAVSPGTNVQLACDALDPEKGDLTYSWTASGGTITGQGTSATWTAPSATGSYKITVTVKDPPGGTASKSVDAYVQGGGSGGGSPPVIKSLTYEPTTFTYDDEIMTLTCVAEDPDGDKLTYAWSAVRGPGGATGTFSGDTAVVKWTPPHDVAAIDEFTISVYCTDSAGNRSGRKFFTLNVKCDCLRPEKYGK